MFLYVKKTKLFLLFFKLTNNAFEDMWFGANDKIFKLVNAFEDDTKEIFIEGHCLLNMNNFFEYPFESSNLDIYMANVNNIPNHLVKFTSNEVNAKYVAIKYNNNHVFIPLLHTIRDV